MHIGVDLDNTLLDATTAHLQYYNKASGLTLTHEDVNDFYLYKMYGWDKAESNVIYYEHGYDIHWNSSPYPQAIQTLASLSKHHNISIITARPTQFRDVTVKWLEHYSVPYNNIVFIEDKLKECMKLQVEVMIDDGPHYAEEFAQKSMPVILYEQPYNRFVKHEFVYHAANWSEVKAHIDNLQKNSHAKSKPS
ncbi:5' nucleotidase, NT5C type [Paenibacillus cellulositrophicus]|uniref:5' nucleotidase, NT5C type n=1 Tax=Paenibacillus cellulositrophicus TaxID=562959 RepID=UPI003D984F3D